jgi:hypothetical protein
MRMGACRELLNRGHGNRIARSVDLFIGCINRLHWHVHFIDGL